MKMGLTGIGSGGQEWHADAVNALKRPVQGSEEDQQICNGGIACISLDQGTRLLARAMGGGIIGKSNNSLK